MWYGFDLAILVDLHGPRLYPSPLFIRGEKTLAKLPGIVNQLKVERDSVEKQLSGELRVARAVFPDYFELTREIRRESRLA